MTKGDGSIDIFDPDQYVSGPPHETFERLRRTRPVCWQEMSGGTGCWAILKHADVMHVAREPVLFSASAGGVVLEDLAPDRLAMMNTSANRDEDVFDDQHRFDIRRDPNPHLSFGIAEHFCLGAHLTRLEGRLFFEDLLAYSRIQLAGEQQPVRSNLNNGLKRLPVRLAA
jgi:cytochrome P450